MSRINEMTMSEILEEAQKRGFDPSPWKGKNWYSWNNGVEVAAIEYLNVTNAPDLYEEDEDGE